MPSTDNEDAAEGIGVAIADRLVSADATEYCLEYFRNV